jgi:hypothetical protein
MKMKTINLTGDALDWAVDKSLNLNTPYNSWGQTGKVPLYSDDWAQGGPIIEAWAIDVGTYRGAWRAARHVGNAPTYGYGPTPLIAAMRCYVASKLGNDIDVPTELKGETK